MHAIAGQQRFIKSLQQQIAVCIFYTYWWPSVCEAEYGRFTSIVVNAWPCLCYLIGSCHASECTPSTAGVGPAALGADTQDEIAAVQRREGSRSGAAASQDRPALLEAAPAARGAAAPEQAWLSSSHIVDASTSAEPPQMYGQPISPGLYRRPFKGFIKSPERPLDNRAPEWFNPEKHDWVFVEDYGPMPRASNSMTEGLTGSGLQPRTASNAAVPAPGSPPVMRMTVVRAVPQLKSLRDVQAFWSVWQDGNGVTGPIKDLTAEEKAVGDVRKRYSEYSRAATAIEQMAQATSKTPEEICQDLDKQRERGKGKKPKALAAFLKELCNSKKQGAMAEGQQTS